MALFCLGHYRFFDVLKLTGAYCPSFSGMVKETSIPKNGWSFKRVGSQCLVFLGKGEEKQHMIWKDI